VPAEAARILRTGRARWIDVGRITFINHAGASESRYFLGVASFGMSGKVIERVKKGGTSWLPAARSRAVGGRLSFALATLQTTLSKTSTKAFVQIDEGPERRLTVVNLCVANARYFGGGMNIAPEAKLNDGRLDVVVIGDMGALEILANSPRLYLGKHLHLEQVHHKQARYLSARPVNKDEKIALEVDGELLGRLPATFEILPKALRVRCP
jgi:diacylglycerol kinase family enzyme